MITEPREKITILTRKDCDISYFVGPGKGGQNKQKTSSGVNIIHRESGAIGRNSESRSQEQNRKAAFLSMVATPKFQLWLAKKQYEIQQRETMEETVERSMSPDKLRVEVQRDGRWVPEVEAVAI